MRVKPSFPLLSNEVQIKLEDGEIVDLDVDEYKYGPLSLSFTPNPEVEPVGLFFTRFEDGSVDITKGKLENEKPAEKVTPEHVESIITDEKYLTPTDTLTICVLTLKNGASVTGESACADPKLFNKELGEKYARENAFDKAWAFEGYLLKERLFNES